MIEIDSIIVGFVTANPVTCLLALKLLQIIAKATPWAVDDEIIQILTGFMGRKK